LGVRHRIPTGGENIILFNKGRERRSSECSEMYLFNCFFPFLRPFLDVSGLHNNWETEWGRVARPVLVEGKLETAKKIKDL
jgi:hypothetical protein